MTITNAELIDEALRDIGVVGEGQSASAYQAKRALRALNQMLAMWAEQDCDLHFPPQRLVDLSTTCPIPPWAELGIQQNLSVICSTKFRSPLRPDLATEADDRKRGIFARVMNDNLRKADMSHLPYGELGRWDINLDSRT